MEQLPYACDHRTKKGGPLCPRSFRSPEELRQHMLEHFKCCDCRQRFYTKEALKQHRDIHKVFPCGHDKCNARFARSVDLSRHERIHSKDSTLSCRYCPHREEAGRKDNLRNHERDQHPRDYVSREEASSESSGLIDLPPRLTWYGNNHFGPADGNAISNYRSQSRTTAPSNSYSLPDNESFVYSARLKAHYTPRSGFSNASGRASSYSSANQLQIPTSSGYTSTPSFVSQLRPSRPYSNAGYYVSGGNDITLPETSGSTVDPSHLNRTPEVNITQIPNSGAGLAAPSPQIDYNNSVEISFNPQVADEAISRSQGLLPLNNMERAQDQVLDDRQFLQFTQAEPWSQKDYQRLHEGDIHDIEARNPLEDDFAGPHLDDAYGTNLSPVLEQETFSQERDMQDGNAYDLQEAERAHLDEQSHHDLGNNQQRLNVAQNLPRPLDYTIQILLDIIRSAQLRPEERRILARGIENMHPQDTDEAP